MIEGSISSLTHTWLIGSEVLPCPHLLVIIERVKERYSLPSPYPVILIYYYRPLMGKCIRMSYFLVTQATENLSTLFCMLALVVALVAQLSANRNSLTISVFTFVFD